MKTYHKVLIAVAGASFLGLAAHAWIHRTHLPAERPSGLVIEWNEGGGMNPEGSRVIIQAGMGTQELTDWADGQITNRTVNFTPTTNDLDALYAIIRSNSFDTIQTSNSTVYDGGNNSVRISWWDSDVDIWGVQVIEWDRSRFERVYSAISSYVNTHAVQSAP